MINRALVVMMAAVILLGALCLRVGAPLYDGVPKLSQRAMHNDEGVNTIKFRDVWDSGKFQYDPREYHGSTLYYLTFPAVWISGAKSFVETNEAMYRAVPVVFGLLLILLTLGAGREIGWGAALWAGALLAVSPAMVYYSRYYIHEMLLVFFTFAAILCGWRFWIGGKWLWAILTGVCVGLMFATKETWVLPMAAASGAIVLTWLVEMWLPSGHPPMRPKAWRIVASMGVAMLVAGVLFSGFLTRPRGMLDSLTAYRIYLERGSGGHMHDHPFGWYLELLWWHQSPVSRAVKVNKNPVFTEAVTLVLALLGVAIALVGMRRRQGEGSLGGEEMGRWGDGEVGSKPTDRGQRAGGESAIGNPQSAILQHSLPLIRFLAFYTLLLTLFYSLIPYKTPWCALGFLHGMILLAGFAAARIVGGAMRLTLRLGGGGEEHGLKGWIAWLAGGLVGLVVLWPVYQPFSLASAKPPWAIDAGQVLVVPGWSLWSQAQAACSERWNADKRNPWVYAHTTADIFAGVRLIREIAQVHPPVEGQLFAAVVTIDSWPLPWYLRSINGMGWWSSYANFSDYMTAMGRSPAADVIIGPEDVRRRLAQQESQGGPAYEASSFGLRPGVVLWIMVREPIWKKLVEKWEKESVGRGKK